MNVHDLRALLEAVSKQELSIDGALENLKLLPYKDLGFASIDNHRELRVGVPEVIYCQGKTPEHVKGIMQYMLTANSNILATRVTEEVYEAVKGLCYNMEYNKMARTIFIQNQIPVKPATKIAVITAGTSDIPVAEEAAVTAEALGNDVDKIFDVGVAGLHRLLGKLERIRSARVLIVVAGMEGALPSVIGGLVNKPVIAVPTSIGYGSNFGGLSALLGMLTSCSSGISVVNIDNGFGAGYLANMINRL
jgi:pyridinium-3,5-biscarboxylic acid mononucleotide synthase